MGHFRIFYCFPSLCHDANIIYKMIENRIADSQIVILNVQERGGSQIGVEFFNSYHYAPAKKAFVCIALSPSRMVVSIPQWLRYELVN